MAAVRPYSGSVVSRRRRRPLRRLSRLSDRRPADGRCRATGPAAHPPSRRRTRRRGSVRHPAAAAAAPALAAGTGCRRPAAESAPS